ncbi:hypothetical protein LTR62_005176 [Meristemomyces frigidus]|uniref:NAD(P)-binding domain-containing protein n=1 Tax=Meristemomyces frigidus TaxID=1508187 RepID=A0AAN7YFK0_9PEZI|nr:hypothetical protein LTR62_005176 [Meristemomyces frigidus]
MPTYALLGATGGTGSAILRYYLESPPLGLHLKILVRDKAKLQKAFPDLAETAPFHIEIFKGTHEDDAILQQCLKDATVIHMCIATNISVPTTSICLDTTTALISVLESLSQRQGTSYTKPTILQLRSINLNPKATTGAVIERFVQYCLYYVYDDLAKGCTLLEQRGKADLHLFDFIFVDPPGLHDAEGSTRTGHMLSTTEKVEGDNLMYADLGAAFCEIAERKGEFLGQAVLVSATGKVELRMMNLLGFVGTGLKARLWG